MIYSPALFLCPGSNFRIIAFQESHRGFPGGPVVKNPPWNEGAVGLIPGWGTKIPRATKPLSLRIATTEPVCSSVGVLLKPQRHN